MALIDISRALHSGAPHWPGDTPTEFALTARIAQGSTCNVGRLALSVHNGTHVDAPFHYRDSAATIEALPPDLFVGPARVIDARGQAALTAALFEGLPAHELAATPRILFRTDVWTDPTQFPIAWPQLDAALPGWLGRQGIRLVGVDFPSVDELASKTLPLHQACADAGLLILENLDLTHAPPGIYDLIALPLRILGGDASPVRAVLRRTGGD